MATKLRKNERNAKEKLVFLFISECQVSSANTKVTKSREQNKRIYSFLNFIPRGGIFARQLERKNSTEISFVRDGCLRDGPIDEI